MRLSYVMSILLGIAVVPGTVSAQFYQQDFSATFPPPVENPGRVTVIMINESGDTIIPYDNFPVPGLTDYVGRHQVAARTGGANANQEISAITSVYTLNASDTTEQYVIDPLPATGGNGVYPPDIVLDDNFITLSEDGIGDIQSAVAWDEQYAGQYGTARHDFVFRISGIGNQANDQADGLGWAYLNSANYGTTGVSGPGISEEPNFAGSLGVGFDIWDNGGEGGNSVSLHFDGRVLDSRPIDPGTTNPDTGLDWEFNSFETDELIQTTVLMTPGEDAGTQVPVLKGGSPYSTFNQGGRVSEIIQVGGADSMDGHLRIAEEAAGVVNTIAFDYDGSGAHNEYNISFEFRGFSEDTTRADGMSFLLVPTDLYDETGADLINFGPHEEPNLAGALGIGFDTFNSDADAQDDPELMPNVGNHVSVHFDGTKLTQENFDLADLDLVTTDADVWHTASISIVGDDLSVIITDGTDGSQHVAFADTISGLSAIGTVRPAFAARTGGAYDNYEIDNFLMTGAATNLPGDYNMDGVVDTADIDLQAVAMKTPTQDLATFDENGDGTINELDRTIWVTDHAKTWYGDANFDGVFSTDDLVAVFAAGKYETGGMAVWAEGDWTGDMVFDSGDLVAAFSDGGFELGPRPAVSAVPEPSSVVLLLLGCLAMIRRRK